MRVSDTCPVSSFPLLVDRRIHLRSLTSHLPLLRRITARDSLFLKVQTDLPS